MEEDIAVLDAVQQAPKPKKKTRQQETRMFINGWMIYHLRKADKWKVVQRGRDRNYAEFTVDTKGEAISLAENAPKYAAAEEESPYVV